MESVKKLGASRAAPLIRGGYRLRRYSASQFPQWLVDREVKWFTARHPVSEADATEFLKWIANSPHDVENWLVSKSPAMAAKLAVSNRTRLHPEAEKTLLQKGKDKAGLLDYCTHFGIIIADSSNVTLKAAFSDDRSAWREKRYIKKMEETKRNLKLFLAQMVNAGQVRMDQTVSEVMESI